MNRKKNSTLFIAIALLGSVIALPFEVVAQANFEEVVNFKVLRTCNAYTSFRKQTGEIDLEVDRLYPAYAVNKASDASHVHIKVGSSRKWVNLDCGDYDQEPKIKVSADHEPDQSACLPFFDQEDNLVLIKHGGEVDITPEAPAIEPFGEAVNKVCGAAGKVTTQEEFKQLMTEHPDVLSDLMDYTGNRVFGDRDVLNNKEAYLQDLTEAWYAIHAFDHIFCGEPTNADKIGGLHFHGRYQQLQASGEACRLPVNFNRNEVVPGSIYSMGVRMKRTQGGWAKFPIKGYGLTLSAADMLKVVTRGFAENPTDSDGSTGCILAVNDEGVKYDTVLVRRASGLRTFFPDATPDFQRNPACANPVTLSASTDSIITQPARRDSENHTEIISNGRFNVKVITSDEEGITLRITEGD